MSSSSKSITAIAAAALSSAPDAQFRVLASIKYDPRYAVPADWNTQDLTYLGQDAFPMDNIEDFRAANAKILRDQVLFDLYVFQGVEVSKTKLDAAGQPLVSPVTSFVAIAGNIVVHGFRESYGGHPAMTAARVAAVNNGLVRYNADKVVDELGRKIQKGFELNAAERKEYNLADETVFARDPVVLAFKLANGVDAENIDPTTDFVGRAREKFSKARRPKDALVQMRRRIMISSALAGYAASYDQVMGFLNGILGLNAESASSEVVAASEGAQG